MHCIRYIISVFIDILTYMHTVAVVILICIFRRNRVIRTWYLKYFKKINFLILVGFETTVGPF